MPTVNGRRYLDQALTQIRKRTKAHQRTAVAFDIDNTLFDTRGRALAVGKKFDRVHGTAYFKGKTKKSMGNDAKETATKVKMSAADAKKFSGFWFHEFLKGSNYKNDTQIKQAVELAKKAAQAGADVYYVTGRAQSEEGYTMAQLKKAGLPSVDAEKVVSKPHLHDKTPEYKAGALEELAHDYSYVGWFITESKKDISGIQRLDAPVKSVLMKTKFSGEGEVASDTPVWPVDVK